MSLGGLVKGEQSNAGESAGLGRYGKKWKPSSEATMVHARKTILAKSGLRNQQQLAFLSDFARLPKETILATYPAWRNHPHSYGRYKATRYGVLRGRLPPSGGGMFSITNQQTSHALWMSLGSWYKATNCGQNDDIRARCFFPTIAGILQKVFNLSDKQMAQIVMGESRHF